ncbi:hypothetical protein Gotri_019595 [Gossypium trilobum]|uniref:Disease resistance protein n=1 Tax=Gossypium trilobum TaxID=34281 RepID=A0A7J9EDF7_9ROSI|nr:hypothetical protein [Gossypium trilobum]
MDSRQAEFDRGHAIMNKLLRNCLLEVFHGSDNERSIRMHDLVRDMALHITRAKPLFLVKADMGLREPPKVQEWSEDLEKVSLMWNGELEDLYPLEMSPPKCPMLTTLLLPGCGIKSIPEGFFNHMDGLKILKLSLNPIKSLPNSISNLKNLTALLLAYCDHLEYVPSLSKLRVLKELDLRATKIREVPHGMQNLLSLKYLDLKHSIVLEIPNGILSKLSCLQILNVSETLVSGKEVGKLKKLEMVEGRFYDFQDLSMYLQAFHGREEPPKYIIHMCKRPFPAAILTTKGIELGDSNISNQIMLPRDIEELYAGNCTFCCHVNYPLFSSLLKLKKLVLEWLPELKSICNVDAVVVCESLKWIGVRDCPKLKRMPLKLPQVPPFSPLKLRIYVKPKEWWESAEWDDPDAKSLLKRFVNFVIW